MSGPTEPDADASTVDGAAPPPSPDPPASDDLDIPDFVPHADRPGVVGALYRHRRVLFAAGLVWFGLVVFGGILLSTVDARVGLHVFGPDVWVAGEPAVLRVTLRDLRYNRFEPLGGARVRFVSNEGVEGEQLTLAGHAGPFVQGAVPTPSTPGKYKLVLEADGEEGPLLAEMTVNVLDRAPPMTLPAGDGKPKHPPRPDRGPFTLDIVPTDQVMPGGGLPTTLTVRATDLEGRPQQLEVALDTKEGKSEVAFPSRITTDRHGLARFTVVPQHPTFWFELSTPTANTARRLKYVPTQFVIDVPQSVVTPGRTLKVEVRSLHQSGEVFVDAWHGDRWVATEAGELERGRAQVGITLPLLGVDPALIWLQAYKTAYLPQQARGGLHLLVTTKSASEANRWLADQLVKADLLPGHARFLRAQADGDPQLARFLLGRIPRPERDPPLLADSGVTARQTVATLRVVWQRRLIVALVLTGLAMFGVLGWLVVSNYREVQARWEAAGGADEGEAGTRRRILVDAGYIFAILAIFLLGMVQLLLSIRW